MAITSKRKNSAAKNNALDRPFDPHILRDAEAMVKNYQVAVWFDSEEGEWYGRGVELPLVMGDGANAQKCVMNTQEALRAVVATMLERGEKPPVAINTANNRTEQINLRLTPAEKLRLEDSAQRGGFRGVSDYVRAVALSAR